METRPVGCGAGQHRVQTGAARVRGWVAPGAACGLLLALLSCTPAPGGDFQGVVEYASRALAFEVPGRVAEIRVERGQRVEAGALLARLDDREAALQRTLRQAELDAASAQLQLLQAGSRPEERRQIEAQVEAARAALRTLERSLRRQRELVDAGAAPPATVDDLEDELDRAKANLSVLLQRLKLVRSGARAEELAIAQARVAAARAALDLATEQQRRYSLYAPIAGEVIDLVHEEGEVTPAGTPVVLLADTAHPYVDAFVPQGRLDGLRVGTAATVRVDALSTALSGTIEHIFPKTEFTPHYLFSERERPHLVVRVRVRIEDPERRLHAGIPAFVRFGHGP